VNRLKPKDQLCSPLDRLPTKTVEPMRGTKGSSHHRSVSLLLGIVIFFGPGGWTIERFGMKEGIAESSGESSVLIYMVWLRRELTSARRPCLAKDIAMLNKGGRYRMTNAIDFAAGNQLCDFSGVPVLFLGLLRTPYYFHACFPFTLLIATDSAIQRDVLSTVDQVHQRRGMYATLCLMSRAGTKSAQELANMIKSRPSSGLKEFAVVDVRDDDFVVSGWEVLLL